MGTSSAISTDNFSHVVDLYNSTGTVVVAVVVDYAVGVGVRIVVAAATTATFAATVGHTDIAGICNMVGLRPT